MVLEDMVQVLSQCGDFKVQNTLVEELLQTCGKHPHRVFMLPKFHAELNCIETKWAVGKGRARKKCTGKMTTFRKVFKSELNNITVQEIRRFARKAREWMSAYRDIGQHENDINFHSKLYGIVKSYRSHRRVFEHNFKAMQELCQK
eukprot:Pompholyxophrys_sp_v1_NODE_73_length_2430_cov_9.351579.p2 type:complete len:146 gc:universal NODE_73_length_2430_cov_9.351579:488-51(-)